MASHRVRMSVPGFDIGGSNVEFVVGSNRRTPSGDPEKLGELHISKGSPREVAEGHEAIPP